MPPFAFGTIKQRWQYSLWYVHNRLFYAQCKNALCIGLFLDCFSVLFHPEHSSRFAFGGFWGFSVDVAYGAVGDAFPFAFDAEVFQ